MATISRSAVVCAMVLFQASVLAQSPTPPPRDVHQAMTTKPEGGPATLVVQGTPQGLNESPIAAALKDQDSEVRSYHEHVTTLANPFFEGRVPGSRGNRMAADYIQWSFEKAGLKPVFESDTRGESSGPLSFRQTFRAGTDTKVAAQELSFTAGSAGPALQAGKDFVALGLSGRGEASLPVVFAGYAIGTGEGGYTSFGEGADLTGKIALIFRFEPMDAEGKSIWTKGNGWSPASSLDEKIKAAVERKAAGVIVVNPPGAADPRANSLMDTRATLALGGRDAGVPVVMVSGERMESVLASLPGEKRTLQSLRAIADAPEAKGTIVPLEGLSASMKVDIQRNPIMTDNVGAVLPGKGALAQEWIVIGAHYDHVGWGPTGARPENIGKLHPGADDNASGTSGLLVLARRLAAQYAAMPEGANARSVLFLAFCAEESGLNGSRFYVNNPPRSIPNDKIALMVNLDMIGRLKNNTVEVQGTESGVGLYDMLKPLFEASGLEVKHGSTVASNSDHASFYNKNIPVLFFFTGLHRDYHTPTDTSDLINSVGAVKVVSLVEQTVMTMATRGERLAFNAANRSAQAASPGPMRTRVRFGIAPGSYSDDKPGIEVGDVYENTPAAEAGIKTGDRMIKWNGQELRRVEDWMPMLAKHNPGDVVDVTILRDGKEQVVKVTLKGRDSGGR